MYSPTKAKDMKWRKELLDQMLDALNNNCPITAKTIGQMTRQLDEKIRTHDYTEDDARHYRLAKMDGKIADIKAGFPLKELTVK
jgi:hypothetical protein